MSAICISSKELGVIDFLHGIQSIQNGSGRVIGLLCFHVPRDILVSELSYSTLVCMNYYFLHYSNNVK
jgi:hypothetical protein